MLKDVNTFSSFSIKDVETSKEFYEKVLGLGVTQTPEGLELSVPSGRIFLYPKGDHHQAATFTALNFLVEDINSTVDGLQVAGVHFEIYDMPNKPDEKGIYWGDGSMGPRAIAWFKDPSGNVLSLIQEK